LCSPRWRLNHSERRRSPVTGEGQRTTGEKKRENDEQDNSTGCCGPVIRGSRFRDVGHLQTKRQIGIHEDRRDRQVKNSKQQSLLRRWLFSYGEVTREKGKKDPQTDPPPPPANPPRAIALPPPAYFSTSPPPPFLYQLFTDNHATAITATNTLGWLI
jgi:hypothetical protein